MELTPPGGPLEAPEAVETPAPTRRRRGTKGTITNRAAGVPGAEAIRMQVAMMSAAACHPTAISRGLKLSRERVTRILGQADTAGLVEDFRKIVRAHALSQSLDIAVKGMAWVNETIDQREPKAFDLVTRGLSNMEKLWSSASGETRPQGVQVAVINQTGETSVEIARLVEMLVGPQS